MGHAINCAFAHGSDTHALGLRHLLFAVSVAAGPLVKVRFCLLQPLTITVQPLALSVYMFLCCIRRPEMVVGWYHSHPGFGCWLSGVDINTQQVGSRCWKSRFSGIFLAACRSLDVNAASQHFHAAARSQVRCMPRNAMKQLQGMACSSTFAAAAGIRILACTAS